MTIDLASIRQMVAGKVIQHGGVTQYAAYVDVPDHHIETLMQDNPDPPVIPHRQILKDLGLQKHKVYAKVPKES